MLLQAIADQSEEEINLDSFGFRQPSFCMRQVSFPRSSIHSSMRLHMKWLTGVFYKSVGAASTFELSKPLNGSILIA